MTDDRVEQVVREWLKSRTRKGGPSRNTVASGLVVLDMIARLGHVTREQAFTEGGEIVGARSGLPAVLSRCQVDSGYLKEVTTRQAATDAKALYDALEYGRPFAGMSEPQRLAVLARGMDLLRKSAQEWLDRKHLALACDPKDTPFAWVEDLLEQGQKRSGGKVEQHLVGAKLERRFSATTVPNQPGNAADAQTGRAGDFSLGRTVFHVTVSPSSQLVEKCERNLQAGLKPILVVPRTKVGDAVTLVADRSLKKRIAVLSIEEFIATNVIELAEGDDAKYLAVMKDIVEIYNRRLRAVETDLSLTIDIEE